MSLGQNLEMTEGFLQISPELGNQYSTDFALKNILATYLPKDILQKTQSDFLQVGEDAAGKLLRWSLDAETNIPVLTQFDPWGKRIDLIQMSDSWKKLEAYSAEHGLVASAYERKYSEWTRVYQMVLIYLFHPSSAFFSCPLAMTDGAAKLFETYGSPENKSGPFKHLISRNPKDFWTSGQWMTEKIGGSDVGQSEAVAKVHGKGYTLHGIKFFTSATTCPMTMTLARIEGAESGGRGLSLFYLDTGLADGKPNHIQIIRLKDKLGTRALPTAELKLLGTPAYLVGGTGDGIKKIATLFNVTRIYNAICSVAQMRRAIAWAQDYAKKRAAFGDNVMNHALFKESFADAVVEFEGCLHLIFRVAHLLGKEESGLASPAEIGLRRLLTPIAKLYTGKSAVSVVSEMVEVFAGVGYCEDSGIPKQLRDAQVFPIWEGTTNVLSLDVLRALTKECPFENLLQDIQGRIKALPSTSVANQLQEQVQELTKFAKEILEGDLETANACSREFALSLGRISIASLLAESAVKEATPRSTARLQRWVELSRKYLHANPSRREDSRLICDF